MKAGDDPRPDQHPKDDPEVKPYPNPGESKPYPAPGGAGTGTKDSEPDKK